MLPTQPTLGQSTSRLVRLMNLHLMADNALNPDGPDQAEECHPEAEDDAWKAAVNCECCAYPGAGYLMVLCEHAGPTHLVGRHQYCMQKPYSLWPTPAKVEDWEAYAFKCSACQEAEKLLEELTKLSVRRRAVHPSEHAAAAPGSTRGGRLAPVPHPLRDSGRALKQQPALPKEPRLPQGPFAAHHPGHPPQGRTRTAQGSRLGELTRNRGSRGRGRGGGGVVDNRWRTQGGNLLNPESAGPQGSARAGKVPMPAGGQAAAAVAAGEAGLDPWRGPGDRVGRAVVDPGQCLSEKLTLHLNNREVISTRVTRSPHYHPTRTEKLASEYNLLLFLLKDLSRLNGVVVQRRDLAPEMREMISEPQRHCLVAEFEAHNEYGSASLSKLLRPGVHVAVVLPPEAAFSVDELAVHRDRPLLLEPREGGRQLGLLWPRNKPDLEVMKEQLGEVLQAAAAAQGGGGGGQVRAAELRPVGGAQVLVDGSGAARQRAAKSAAQQQQRQQQEEKELHLLEGQGSGPPLEAAAAAGSGPKGRLYNLPEGMRVVSSNNAHPPGPTAAAAAAGAAGRAGGVLPVPGASVAAGEGGGGCGENLIMRLLLRSPEQVAAAPAGGMGNAAAGPSGRPSREASQQQQQQQGLEHPVQQQEVDLMELEEGEVLPTPGAEEPAAGGGPGRAVAPVVGVEGASEHSSYQDAEEGELLEAAGVVVDDAWRGAAAAAGAGAGACGSGVGDVGRSPDHAGTRGNGESPPHKRMRTAAAAAEAAAAGSSFPVPTQTHVRQHQQQEQQQGRSSVTRSAPGEAPPATLVPIPAVAAAAGEAGAGGAARSPRVHPVPVLSPSSAGPFRRGSPRQDGLEELGLLAEGSGVAQLLSGLAAAGGLTYWSSCVQDGAMLDGSGNLRVVCAGFSDHQWSSLQGIVRGLEENQQLRASRNSPGPLLDLLSSRPAVLPPPIEAGSFADPPSLSTVLLFPEHLAPEEIQPLLLQLELGAQHNQAAAAGAGQDAGTGSSGSGNGTRNEWGPSRTAGEFKAPVRPQLLWWRLLASPLAVFAEGLGEGFLNARFQKGGLPGQVVDYQLYRRGLALVVGGFTFHVKGIEQQLERLLWLLEAAQGARGVLYADWHLAVRREDVAGTHAEHALESLLEGPHRNRVMLMEDLLPQAAGAPTAGSSDGASNSSSSMILDGGRLSRLPRALQDAVLLARRRQRLLRMVVVVLPDVPQASMACPMSASPGPPSNSRSSGRLGQGWHPHPHQHQQQQYQQRPLPGYISEWVRTVLVAAQDVGEVCVGTVSQVEQLMRLIVPANAAGNLG